MYKWNIYYGLEVFEKSVSFDFSTFLIAANPVVRLLEKSTAVINQIRQERMRAGANLTDKTFLHNSDCNWSFNLFDPTDSVLFSKKSWTINFSFLETKLSVVLVCRAVGLLELGAAVLDTTQGAEAFIHEKHTLLELQKPSNEVMTQKAALQS